jgi:hypothetical protein
MFPEIFLRSFIIVVFKMLHPKLSMKILKISVKKNNFKFNFFFIFGKIWYKILSIINKLFNKFPRVLHLLLDKLTNFHKNHF